MFHLNNCTLLLCVLLPFMGYAQNDEKKLQANVHFNGDNPMLIHIRFDNPTKRMANVSIRSPKNNLIYTKWTSRSQANLKFDIEHMAKALAENPLF